MKKFAAAIALLFAVSIAGAHGGAHSGLPEPGHLPGSLMYNVDQFVESASLFLTFSEKGKMKKKISYAKERLAESAKLMKMNRSKKAAELASTYSRKMKNIADKAEKSGMTEISRKVRESLNKSTDVLMELKNKLPEQARQGVETAISNVKKVVPVPVEGKEKEGPGRPPTPGSKKEKSGSPEGYTATGRVIQSVPGTESPEASGN